MKALLHSLLEAATLGRPVVLCTVVHSGGSAPRSAGAHMAVFADGSTRGTVGGGRLELGRIAIDTDLMVAYKDGRPLELTQREYELLKFLAAQPGKVFSREALMEHVWNYEGYVGDVRAVDVAVRRLREKVEDDPASPQFVVTRRGLGYYFNA